MSEIPWQEIYRKDAAAATARRPEPSSSENEGVRWELEGRALLREQDDGGIRLT